MSYTPPLQKPPSQLEYAITHVFLPAPSEADPPSDYTVENDHFLARTVYAAAHTYSETIDDTVMPQWCCITKMLDNLAASIHSNHLDHGHVISQLRGMHTGDILAFFSRAQDAAVIFRKQDHCTLYESFQTSWDSDPTLAGSYPESVVEIPDELFRNEYFESELANFLLYKAGAIYPKLLTSILQGVGRNPEVTRIIKRVHSHCKPGPQSESWSRSSLWLLIKVAIQTSLDRGSLGHICYKAFMLHFMCNLAKDAIHANLSSSVLYAISAKILRRLRKLGSVAPNWLFDMVLKTNGSLEEILKARWKEVEAAEPPPTRWKPSQLDLDRDMQLLLVQSKEYICNSLTNQDPEPLDFPFRPKHHPRGTLNDFLFSNGTFFETAYHADPYVALYDFEQAVEQEIDDWVTCVTHVDQACVQLEILMGKYLSSASYTYQGNPEHLSIMLLTVIDLWVALDKIVVGAVPMLNYSPQIPTELLCRPLLHRTTNIHRICRAYQYLSARHSRFLPGHESMCLDEFTKNNFPVCYNVNSPAALQYHIEGYGRTVPVHVDIDLRFPVSLHVWRSGTARILDVFFFLQRMVQSKLGASVPLASADIPCLRPYLVQLTSPVTGQFHSKDYKGTVFVRDGYFKYQLPSSLGLHRYVDATSHTSNSVLAAQAKYPDDFLPSEFLAFGHLRSGGSLQWVNILRELRDRTLNFRRQDVHLLLVIAASQVGPLDLRSMEWVWHQELQESSFCYALLDELESFLMDVGACSMDAVMMGNISFLLTRLLATSCHEDILDGAIRLLRQVRTKTFDWVQELSYDLMMAPTNTERSKLLMDMAATCRSTFDVGPTNFHMLLYSAEDVDALLSCAIFIHANSSINSNSIPKYSRLLLERDRRLSLVLEDVLRDVIQADPSNQGIDLAIRNVWSGYRPGPRRWQPLPCPSSHWLSCETVATGSGRSQTVHLNLLDGTLLVDSKPINGLPQEIRVQTLYKRIFGDKAFLVIASDLPGMDFSTLVLISEHRVHFALRGDDLVVRVQHKDSTDILEAIPQEKLQGDLPTTFVHGHIHWLNLSTSVVEIRPLEKLWEQSSQNWRIDCAPGRYHMYKGRERLVDIRSPTWEMVSSRLKCLDVPENLIITTFPIDTPQSLPIRRLSVVMPRYGLSFFVNEDEGLESSDFQDMVYDENQCIGTLFGLQNRLVLRQNTQVEEELVHRCIIIPDGTLSRKQHNYHLQIKRVTVSAQNTHILLPTLPVTYHTYIVDTDLGCLTGYHSWRSKLYLAHLHAQTSVDWRPDPLSGRTGIQEALRLLRSAGCRSIMELDTRHGESNIPSSCDYKIYPQIRHALEEIEYLIQRVGNWFDPKPRPPQLLAADVVRTSYLFLFEDVVPMPVPTSVSPEKFSEPMDLAYIVSLAVHHWLINMENGVESQGDSRLDPGDSSSNCFSQSPEQHWSERNVAPPSIADVGALLQEATAARHRFRLLFSLPTVVYRQKAPQPAFLSILIALAKRFPLENPPHYAECRPSYGFRLDFHDLLLCFGRARSDIVEDLDPDWPRTEVHQLLMAWPSETAPVISPNAHLYDVKRLNIELQTLFFCCYRNLALKEDLTNRLTELKSKLQDFPAQPSRHAPDPLSEAHCCTPRHVTLRELLFDRSPPKLPARSRLRRCRPQDNRLSSNSDTLVLNQLFASLRLQKTVPPFQQQYLSRLHTSAQYARKTGRMTCAASGEPRPSTEELQKHYVQCRANYMAGLTIIKKVLGPMDGPLEQALDRSGQWPRIVPDTLLRCLASTSPIRLPDSWKDSLVSLALLLLELQRARRLLRLALENLEDELSRELENEGCDGWRAEEYPDWLLIQLEGNLLIRGPQADVAIKMISSPPGENTTMQVNMGEGKTSVIMPISAATLADGNQLVRVIVPKALTVQTFRLLVGRLGGLANRPVYHLPFSRSLAENHSEKRFNFEGLHQLMVQCTHDRGILVVQPEHLLSLKLMSVQMQLQVSKHIFRDSLSEALARANELLALQRWVQSCARDILDENDEVLHPRFQLMYTIGLQQHMEGYPDRWAIAQQILRLVRRHALSLSQDLPNDIEYECSPSGSFPYIRILHASDARQRLISLIVDDVMDGHLSSFSFLDIDRSNRRLRTAVRAFISSKDVSQWTACIVKEYAQRDILWNGILLLRGLLACNTLLFALGERRWRVDYGLSPTRTMLAVPYHAKDVPAPRTEFGHPDVAIVLTCLSHYYSGLTEEQLRASFEILQAQDDPSTEYANWLRDFDPDTVPKCIQDLSNVNIKPSDQWDKYLFPLFCRNQGAVDLYLSRVVFPKEAKEFPWKLAASSWDLSEIRERPITGFSGTNDGQDLLPTSITQRDLDHQRGTNARVLAHLLQSENNLYMPILCTNGERRTTIEFLRMVLNQKPEIRVFLDVGAQILDFSNYQVAKAWLDLSFDSDGAIYFDEDDELMVLTKDGTHRPLLSSPLAQRIDRCVVYLDDAHTRGTDLKFPNGFRAAVTLGPKVTKDRLVQGCMRMRKLGHGHSVMFFAPPEVDWSIRAVAAKEDQNIPITTTDILRWAIHETWTDIQERAPYWAQQAISHRSRYDAWARFCSNELTGERLADTWLQPELKSLANLYAPFQPQSVPSYSPVLDDFPEIQQHCIDLGVLKLPETQMDEEQEREVNRETERERDTAARPPDTASPAEHSLHPDVVTFVRTGFIPPLHTSRAFHPITAALNRSSAATTEAHAWSPFILATTDFCETIEHGSCQGKMDEYLRPVQWVLSGKWGLDRVLVLLSPFEADCLMPDIRVSEYVHLHMYTPRTSGRLKPTSDLMIYSIPPVPKDWTPPWDLIDQLNVFAGQLYLRDYKSYLRLRRFLGIQVNDLPKNLGTAVRRNLFTPDTLQEIRNMFGDSPLPSVMMLLAIRRRGLPFAETHMGRILQGQLLTEQDFESPEWEKPQAGRNPTTLSRSSKREWETSDPSSSDVDGDSGRPYKRVRA